ncbi:MAG TPA: rhomboid family intramembrane serine protease [Bacteroidia bacterium]|jgi:membrane associated rhomboid family serine protease
MRNTTSKLFFSFLYPSLFVIILWGIKLFEEVEKVNLAWYGLYPRRIDGLIGILTAPLLHGDFSHLLSNSLPLMILGPIIFYFYRSIAFSVFMWVYLMTGVWVWVAGAANYHIGASGLVYGFITFLFFSGVFRKDTRLLSLSLFVTFLYGSAVWGVFPIMRGISWESHLLGSLAGLITAYNFRKEGPPPRKYDFGDDLENEMIDVSGDEQLIPEEEHSEDGENLPGKVSVQYTFIEKEKDQ